MCMSLKEGVRHLPWCKDKYPDYTQCWAAREGRIILPANCEGCELLKKGFIVNNQHGGRRNFN